MTLRDYFAAHATEEDIRHYQEFGAQSYGGPAIEPKYTREQAKYRYADAMLREREGEQQAEANGKDEAQDEG
jgi:transposase